MIRCSKALKISGLYMMAVSLWILFSCFFYLKMPGNHFALVFFNGLFLGSLGWVLYKVISGLENKLFQHEKLSRLILQLRNDKRWNEEISPESLYDIYLDYTLLKEHEEEICRLNRLYNILSQISRAVSSIRSEEELFQAVCDILVNGSRIKLAWVGKYDRAHSHVIPMAWAGISDEYVQRIITSRNESAHLHGPTGIAINTGKSFICNDFLKDLRAMPWFECVKTTEIQSSAVFPLYFQGKVYGALNVYSFEKGVFQGQEVALLEEAVRVVAFGLEHIAEEEQRRQAEEDLRRANEELEAKIESRTKSLMGLNEELMAMNEEMTVMNEKLNKAKDEAEQANIAKSDFLAKMSHEIRTPINAIIGLNYLMQKSELTGKQKEYVAKSTLSAKNLQVIINDILDFSKIEANKVVIENIDFDLYEVLSNISNIISVNVYEKDLRLHFSVDEAAPQFLSGDFFRLQQIILNLANNAVKFTHKGEISIIVTMLKKTSHAVVLNFIVKDTGIGIPEERQGDLFAPFSQVDMSTTRRYGGTGLGLSICRTLVELMGGTIRVESQEGKGSSFIFTLPFAYGNVKLFDSSLANLKFLRVLLVSPSKEIQSNLKSQLEQFGFICSAAYTAEEFEKSEARYDLILLDKNLKEQDGIQTAFLLRRALGPKVPILMLVSDYRDNALQAEVDLAENELDGTIYYPIGQSRLYNNIICLFEHLACGKKHSDEAHNRFSVLCGSRVLLVEDNEINQQVAKEIMEDEGITVDVAPNGKRAVELVLNKHYDIVLMDIQMPVMDGYEAASRIREFPHTKNLPIIALTADVVKGVADKVFEAGMDGYITKPIEPMQLLSALKRWLYDKGWGLEVEPSLPANETKASSNKAGLNSAAGLTRINGKIETYLALLQLFKEKELGGAGEIKAALMEGKQALAVRIAHTLKGAAGNIGLEDVFAAAAKLEQLLRHNSSLDGVHRELKELEAALNAAPQAIDDFLAEHVMTKEVGGVKLIELKNDMRALAGMIEMNQVAAIDALKKMLPQLKERFGAKTEELKTALLNFDWVHAGEILDSMQTEEGETID